MSTGERRKVRIGDRWVGDGEPCFTCFDAGATHTGLESAKELVDHAARSGVDAIKFRTIFVDKIMSREVVPFQYESTEGTQTESLSDILRRREMPYEDWAKLKAHADQAGVMFFSRVAKNITPAGETIPADLQIHYHRKRKPRTHKAQNDLSTRLVESAQDIASTATANDGLLLPSRRVEIERERQVRPRPGMGLF